ncbi:S8 family serine peptidase [Kaarinaea lacus]
MDDRTPFQSWLVLSVLTAVLLAACSGASETENTQLTAPVTFENVVIECATDCNTVADRITNLGGSVYKTYSNLPAIAASVPANFVEQLGTNTDIKNINKDTLLARPLPRHRVGQQNITGSSRITNINLNTSQIGGYLPYLPKNYSFNNNLTGATDMHSQDITGKGVIVAVIDTGIANNAEIVPALEGTVIGGENFIELPNEPSATSTLNDPHGTWVGSMIAAHLGIVLSNDTPLVQSLLAHLPGSVLPYTDSESLIPMLGTAPESSIYAMKVFSIEGDGAPVSVIIESMDRVLTLKRNYNRGVPSQPIAGDGSEDNPYVYDSLNIQVVNLSLGGLTMFPAYGLEDLLALEMLEEGITVVSAVGNEGFAAITGGSPGTSVGSLTVGALNTPQHERILRDLQFGPGTGMAFRPNKTIQVAPFSSRGPTADGRIGLQVMANGFASFVQGADGDIALISGTSFSSPTIAGASALLWQARPDAQANDIRNALMASASTIALGDYQSLSIDRGNGLINLPEALTILEQGAGSDMPKLPALRDEPRSVNRNIQPLGLNVIELSDVQPFTTNVSLNPGEVAHFFFESDLKTDQVTIRITNFQPALPINEQNEIFGDAFLMTLLDAPTSINDILIDERVEADSDFSISRPQSGIMRLALMGDWTNAGGVSATLEINTRERELARKFVEGKLRDDESDIFEVQVNDSVSKLNFELAWEADWSQYPPHDIDLILFDPEGNPYFEGATLDIPERVTINDPMPGSWTIVITGFLLHGYQDEYELRVTDQNNNSLRRPRRRDRD